MSFAIKTAASRATALLLSAISASIVGVPSYAQKSDQGSTTSTSADLSAQIEKVKRLENKGSKADLAVELYVLGAKYSNKRDFASAEKYLREALAVEKEVHRPDHGAQIVQIHNSLAYTLSFERKIDEAQAEYEAAFKDASAGIDPDDLAVVYNNASDLMRGTNNFAAAEKYLQKGLAIAGKASLSRARLLNGLARLYRSSNRPQEGIAALKEAVGIVDEIGDEENWGVFMNSLASLQSDTGDQKASLGTRHAVIEKLKDSPYGGVLSTAECAIGDWEYELHHTHVALEHYRLAEKYATVDGESPLAQIRALIGIGSAESDLEDFQEAEKYHQKALDMARSINDISLQVMAATQLASDFILQGAPERALALLKKMESEAPQGLSAKENGGLLLGLGKAYSALGEKDAALKAYRDAIQAYEVAHDPSFKVLALNSLATVALDYDDVPAFNSAYKEAKSLYTSVADKSGEPKLDYNLGQSFLLQGKYKEAIDVFQKTLENLKESGDTTTQSVVLLGLGLSYYLDGDFSKSLQYYKEALASSKDSTSIETQWNCNLGVGKAYKALKQYDPARQYLEKAVALVEKERGNLSRDSFKTHMLDVRRDCFIELIELFGLLNMPYESLEIAERGKARAFLDMLMNRNEKQIDPGDKPSQSYLKSLAPATEGGSRSVSVNSRDVTVTVDDNLISPINAAAPTIAEIKELVKRSNSTFVEYWATGTKIFVWVIQPNGVIYMPPAIEIRVESAKSKDQALQRINKLGAQIVTPATSAEQMRTLGMERQENLRKLYVLLIKPIEQYLPAGKESVVTIVPHNYLFGIPFASLIAADGDYLIEKHTLSYTPAIGVLRATQALTDEVKAKQHKLLAFGNPITKEIAFLGTLPYSEKEVKHIAALYGDTNSTVEVGANATKEKFTALAPQASDIHLATHGLVDQEHPMRSGLVLAPTATDDGLLTVRDILTLKNLKARMVVLSACQTGRGKITGDGVVGLSRAFIIAGTPSVLVSQWNVDDVMTEYQMTKFYQSYLKGMNKAQALRNAQLATIKYIENAPEGTKPQTDPTYLRANPRFWSAFQLIGEHL